MMQTIEVQRLIDALTKITNEPTRSVKVWLPGSTISLSNVFIRNGVIMIEGNVDEGSALSARQNKIVQRGTV